MLCFICNVIFTNFINNISFMDSARPNNTIYLLPSAFSFSRKLLKFSDQIIYFRLPNLICDKISKSCVEFMGRFILPTPPWCKWLAL